MCLRQLSTIQLTKLAIILHDIIASTDMCLFVLRELDRRFGDGIRLQLAYIQRLNEDGGRFGLSMEAQNLST